MEQFIIEGSRRLQGVVVPQGNKNEALPVLCAALMSPEPVRLRNIPDIEDVSKLLKILKFLGAKVDFNKKNDAHDLSIYLPETDVTEIPAELSGSIRGSITLLGAMLAKSGKVYLPKPGGDKIGRRRIDTHLHALEALGAKVKVYNEGYLLEAKKLKGADMLLDEASVTGTENAIMAAAVAHGDTMIENAASEPHVQGLCRMLIQQGVEIDGVGSNRLIIRGKGGFDKLTGADHTIGADYLEVGSFIAMAACTKSEIEIKNIEPLDLRMIKMVFSRLGIDFEYIQQGNGEIDIYVPAKQKMKVQSDVHGEIPKIDDAPWPAFPADLISIIIVAATQCDGTVLIHEKLFESRLYFTDKLISMGAKIVLCDPHRAVVIGPSPLLGGRLTSPDIRAGMALVIASLAAEGESTIQNIEQIDRGYEKIDKRLNRLGAKIKRVSK